MKKNVILVLLTICLAELVSLLVGNETVKLICTCAVIDAISIYFVVLGIFGWGKSGERRNTRKE